MMNIQIEEKEKAVITLAEVPVIKRIENELSYDDVPSLEEYAQQVARDIASAPNSRFEIYRAKANLTKNNNVEDLFFEGSGKFDVWITFLAYNSTHGAYDCGIYLSDVYSLRNGGNKEIIKSKMFIKCFNKDTAKPDYKALLKRL